MRRNFCLTSKPVSFRTDTMPKATIKKSSPPRSKKATARKPSPDKAKRVIGNEKKLSAQKNALKKTLAEYTPKRLGEKFERLVNIVALLRADCPWDKAQTHDSLAHLVLEETYELLDAIDRNDDAEFRKELGDLMLHLCFHALLASEGNRFDMNDVLDSIATKLIFRHPHVFGDDTSMKTEEDVKQNWEKLKMREGRKSLLEGVPKAMPQLLRAHRIQEKASSVGFDWKQAEDVWLKLEEELHELRTAATAEEREEELGDVLFTLVNYSRFIGVNPEDAMRRSTEKFIARVSAVEELIAAEKKSWQNLSAEDLDALWKQAKSALKSS